MDKPLIIFSLHATGKTTTVRKAKKKSKYKILDADIYPIFEKDAGDRKLVEIENCVYLASLSHQYLDGVSKYDCNYVIILPKNKEKYLKRIKKKAKPPEKYSYIKNFYKDFEFYIQNYENVKYIDKYLTLEFVEKIVNDFN